MMQILRILSSIVYVTAACAASGETKPCPDDRGDLQCKKTPIQVRLPPTINPHPETSISWVSPPPGWFYGNWKITLTSQPTYMPFLNFQFDSSPVFPQSIGSPGQNNDLTSFQAPNSTTIHTGFGIDTPRRSNDKSLGSEWNDVYDFVGTGAFSETNNTWELLAWGYDTCGDGYMVIYETPVAANGAPAGLDIESRTDSGPSSDTLNEVFTALRKLNNQALSSLISETVPLVQNGARDGMPPVACDAACVNNTSS